MLELAAKDGITTLAATPHLYPGCWPFDLACYRQRLEQLRRWAEGRCPITLLEGAEVWYTDQTLPMLREGRIPTIAGSCYVLVEFSPKVTWQQFENAVQELFRGGYVPIVAHIERYRGLYRQTTRLIRLRQETDVCFQINSSSILRRNGMVRQLFLKRMLGAQAIDLIATDAHDDQIRKSNMRAAFSRLESQYGQKYAQALTGFRLEEHMKRLCSR